VTRVRELFSSPRRRRRAIWGGGAAAVVVGLITVGVIWPNTAEEVPSELTPGKPQVYHEPKAIKLTQHSRAQALTTAANFVKTAVARQDLERSWLLVSPSLKQGFTLERWSQGEIPVIPYPVAQARWKLDYSYEDALGLQVLLYPRDGSGMRPNLFLMELKPVGDRKHRRWLVDSWTPSGVANPALQAPQSTPGSGGGGGGSAVAGVQSLDPTVVGQGESRLGAGWLIFPIALLAIVPIVLGIFGIRSWRRSRRAERAYREHAQRRAGAPS
jgi:hypothetical protein